MSTTPQPLFDMSKAKPIFDMSKAQPIGAKAPATSAATPPAKKGFFEGEPFIGSTGEALAQGMKEESSIESRKAAAEGAVAGFGLMVPGSAVAEAVAARSIAPLMPLITSYLGAKFGYHVGKDVGGLVGEPEAGGTVGAALGGLVGGVTGKTPTLSIRSLLMNLLKGGEEGETAAAATIKGAATQPAIPSATPAAPVAPVATPAAVSGPETPEALHRFSNSAAVRKQIMEMVKGNQ